MGEDGALRAAAAAVDITPPRPVPLAGFTNRDGAWRRVADPLEANGLLLSGPDGDALIVSLDLLYAGAPIEARIRERAAGRIPPERVLVCATHTHFAPATDPSKPKLGTVDEAYLDLLLERIDTLVDTLLDGPRMPVTLRRFEGATGHAVNRRRRRLRRGRLVTDMAPNPRGPRDDRIALFCVSSLDGQIRAIVWSYACHPVGVPDRHAVSAAFPGAVRAALREPAPGLPVLFLQGFSGNVRPRVIAAPVTFRDHVRGLLRGPEFGRFEEESWRRWSDELAGAVADCAPGDENRDAAVRGRRIDVPRREVLGSDADGPAITWQRLRVGGILDLVAVSAEPFSEFGRFLPDGAIGVGCLGDVFGYLPTDAAIREGGYESAGFLEPFDLAGEFRSGVDAMVRRAVAGL